MIFASGCSTSPTADTQKGYAFDIVQTRFLGSLWNESHAKASIVSQDGGQSFAVPGGDPVLSATLSKTRGPPMEPRTSQAARCPVRLRFLERTPKAIHPPSRVFVSSNGEVTSPFEYLPSESRERDRIWPLGGVHVNGHDYLYYSIIEVFGNGQWDFRGVGSGLARSKVALGPYERIRPDGDWRFPVAPSQVIESEGWIYLFEIKDSGRKQGVILARVRPEKTDPGVL